MKELMSDIEDLQRKAQLIESTQLALGSCTSGVEVASEVTKEAIGASMAAALALPDSVIDIR